METMEKIWQIDEALRAVAKGEKKIKEVVASILENKEELLAYIKEATEKIFLAYSKADSITWFHDKESEEDPERSCLDEVFRYLDWENLQEIGDGRDIFGKNHRDELKAFKWYFCYKGLAYGNYGLLNKLLDEDRGACYAEGEDEIYYKPCEDSKIGECVAVTPAGAVFEWDVFDGWTYSFHVDQFYYLSGLFFFARYFQGEIGQCDIFNEYGWRIGGIDYPILGIELYEDQNNIGIKIVGKNKHYICEKGGRRWIDGEGTFPWEEGYSECAEDKRATLIEHFFLQNPESD